MMRRYLLLISILFLCIGGISGSSAAPILSLSPGEVSLDQGTSTTLGLVLDSAPDGMEAYNVSLAMSDPAIGTFSAVSYPRWAALNTTSGIPGSSIFVKAIDPSMTGVPSGATSVRLCNITILAAGAGSSDIIVTAITMESLNRKAISPVVQNGRLTVTRTGQGSVSVTNAPEAPGTSSGQGTGDGSAGPGSTGTPAVSGNTPGSAPGLTTGPGGGAQTPLHTTASAPGSPAPPVSGSFPWSWAAIGVICVGLAAVIGLYLSRKKG